VIGFHDFTRHRDIIIQNNRLYVSGMPPYVRFYGIHLAGDNILIRNNLISGQSTAVGTDIEPVGIRVFDAQDVDISHNQVQGDFWYGIQAEGARTTGVLAGNRLRDVKGAALVHYTSPHLIVAYNLGTQGGR
jgi:nitrous oxidase accessory protein NosD